jgi:hypothetical protein
MDQRIESFLGDVLALAGEEPDAVREGVRVALASCEALFRVREPNKHRQATGAAAPAAADERGVTRLQRTFTTVPATSAYTPMPEVSPQRTI